VLATSASSAPSAICAQNCPAAPLPPRDRGVKRHEIAGCEPAKKPPTALFQPSMPTSFPICPNPCRRLIFVLAARPPENIFRAERSKISQKIAFQRRPPSPALQRRRARLGEG